MHLKLKLIFLTLLLLLLGCNGRKEHAVNFYYWKSQVDIGATEKKYFDALKAETLYLRAFDVDDEGNGAIAKGKIDAFHPAALNATYVPVVFITNRTFVNKSEKDAELLSTKVFKLIEEICSANSIKSYSEIQIDCDWTASTQEAYFEFLHILKEKAKDKQIQLSATIRLHQLSMTPPPVDRGILMMYNTGDVKQLSCQKPILDMKDVAPYIQHLGSYPLPLSAAYPLFSWRVLFREGKFVGIMHADDDFPVLPSDSIVIRKPEMSDIMEAVRSINHQDEDINSEVILFDLNTDNIKRFKSEDYEKIFNHRSDGSSI